MDFENALSKFLSGNYYAKSFESDLGAVEINRNRIMHGIYTLDCLKEFYIVQSLIEFYEWL